MHAWEKRKKILGDKYSDWKHFALYLPLLTFTFLFVIMLLERVPYSNHFLAQGDLLLYASLLTVGSYTFVKQLITEHSIFRNNSRIGSMTNHMLLFSFVNFMVYGWISYVFRVKEPSNPQVIMSADAKLLIYIIINMAFLTIAITLARYAYIMAISINEGVE